MKNFVLIFIFTMIYPFSLLSQSNDQAVVDSTTKESDNFYNLNFLDRFPHLKQNLYQEPVSPIYLGASLGLIGVLNNRMIFSANSFQVHYLRDFWDVELLSISYGATTASPSYVQSNHFTFRSVPKIHLSKIFSMGLLIGYEYVSFPKIKAVLYKGGYQTKNEPFSSSGPIYGLVLSENFQTNSGYKIKINQVAYQQTYSTEEAGKGWTYLYDLRNLREDKTPIEAGVVFLLEVGFVF